MPSGLQIQLDNNPVFWYHIIMKTTIDIPDEELEKVMRYTGARTKREAVVRAIKDFNKRQKLAEFSKILGTFEDFMSSEDLRKMREDREWNR